MKKKRFGLERGELQAGTIECTPFDKDTFRQVLDDI